MQRIWILVVALLVVSTMGCGGESGPPLVPVTGTVTYNGSPVEGATVTFLVEKSPLMAGGVTDAQGKFTLKTGDREGCPVGKAQIGVSKKEQGAGPTLESTKEATTKMASGAPMMTSEMAPKDLLPAKYVTPSLSGLTETVTAEGPNNFTIDLKD